MFIEMTILYPFSNTKKKLLENLEKQKEELLLIDSCVKYSIYNDTYSNKIIYIVKWISKDDMKDSIDRKTHRKRIEQIMNLQKFPAEVYRLEEHS